MTAIYTAAQKFGITQTMKNSGRLPVEYEPYFTISGNILKYCFVYVIFIYLGNVS